MANSKSSTSVMFCGTAAGSLLPLYIVYRAKNVYDTWIENGPPDARYNATSHLMNEVWKELHENNKAEQNLKAGFRTCGIFPYDKAPVMKKLDKSVAPGVDDVQALSDAVLTYMKDSRQPDPTVKRGKKRKVTTEPGKSISIEDFVSDVNKPTVSKKRKVSSQLQSNDSTDACVSDSDYTANNLAKKPKVAKKKSKSSVKKKTVSKKRNSGNRTVANKRITNKKLVSPTISSQISSGDECISDSKIPIQPKRKAKNVRK